MTIELEDKLYRLRTHLTDISLKDYIEVEEFIKSAPQWIKNLIQGIEDEMNVEEFFTFERDVVLKLSDIPDELLNRCDLGSIHLCFEASKEIILSCLQGIHSKPIDLFTWGEVFKAPVTDTDIAGNTMYCSEITALQMAEASDIHIQSGYRFANNIISILFCDKYNEKECKKRAEGLKDLPMNIVAGCMTHLSRFHEYCRGQYPNVYGGSGKETPTSRFGWGGRILWLGDAEKINNMNAYEFIRQLSFKIAENES